MSTRPTIYHSLLNKTVLITGGAEGIGAATVELFARQGSKVIFLDIATDSAQKTIEHVTSLSSAAERHHDPTIHPPIFYHCDISDLTSIQSTMTQILANHDTINILINNAAAAGSQARINTQDVTPETWEHNINANLRHVFFLTQLLAPKMAAAGGGSIVNLGSITWRIPAADVPVYTACKAAIMGLTRAQSKEFGCSNVRVNSVMPGAIATERQKREVLTDEYRASVMRNQSLQRDLTPVEVARVVVFLSSDDASAVTGSSYVVDGGWCSDP